MKNLDLFHKLNKNLKKKFAFKFCLTKFAFLIIRINILFA